MLRLVRCDATKEPPTFNRGAERHKGLIVALLDPSNPSKNARGHGSEEKGDHVVVLYPECSAPWHNARQSSVEQAQDSSDRHSDVRLDPRKPATLVMFPCVTPGQRYTGYFAGPSGSGKTTVMVKFLEVWQLIPKNKTRKIYIFSAVGPDSGHVEAKSSDSDDSEGQDQGCMKEGADDIQCSGLSGHAKEGTESIRQLDPAFRFLDPKPIYVPIDNRLLTKPLEMDMFRQSMVVFDDVDVVEPKILKDKIVDIRTSMYQIGRHADIDICNTSHLVMDHSRTKLSLNESTHITLFPRMGASYQVRNMLRRYIGLGPAEIEKACNLPGRWITISTRAPRYILYENGCYLI